SKTCRELSVVSPPLTPCVSGICSPEGSCDSGPGSTVCVCFPSAVGEEPAPPCTEHPVNAVPNKNKARKHAVSAAPLFISPARMIFTILFFRFIRLSLKLVVSPETEFLPTAVLASRRLYRILSCTVRVSITVSSQRNSISRSASFFIHHSAGLNQ